MTDVTIKFTGVVRRKMGGVDRINFRFEGTTLGELLDALFAQYELRDLILDVDRNVIPWSRVAVNGRFSYLVGDMQAPINDGDLIALLRHYAVAF